MNIVFVIVVTFVALLGNELWWRYKKRANKQRVTELSRKSIHIIIGTFVAFWPFFLSWQQIELLSVAFLVVVAVSKYAHVFQAIHSVQRPTLGEVFFAIAVGAVAIITHDKWIYLSALLLMSLADGLAAVVGVRFGRRQRYLVFGHAKSLLGTLTFFVVSLTILLIVGHYGHWSDDLPNLIAIAFGASLIENLGIFGLDNLLVPTLTAFMLLHS